MFVGSGSRLTSANEMDVCFGIVIVVRRAIGDEDNGIDSDRSNGQMMTECLPVCQCGSALWNSPNGIERWMGQADWDWETQAYYIGMDLFVCFAKVS